MYHIYLQSPEGTAYLTEKAPSEAEALARLKVLEKSESYPASAGFSWFIEEALTWDDLQW